MLTRFLELPPLARSLAFVCAMLALDLVLMLVAATMAAFGYPALFEAVTQAEAWGWPKIDFVMGLLPYAAAADVMIANTRAGTR